MSEMLHCLLQLLVGGSNVTHRFEDEGFYSFQSFFAGDICPSPIFITVGLIMFDPMPNQYRDLSPFSHIPTSFFRG